MTWTRAHAKGQATLRAILPHSRGGGSCVVSGRARVSPTEPRRFPAPAGGDAEAQRGPFPSELLFSKIWRFLAILLLFDVSNNNQSLSEGSLRHDCISSFLPARLRSGLKTTAVLAADPPGSALATPQSNGRESSRGPLADVSRRVLGGASPWVWLVPGSTPGPQRDRPVLTFNPVLGEGACSVGRY